MFGYVEGEEDEGMGVEEEYELEEWDWWYGLYWIVG